MTTDGGAVGVILGRAGSRGLPGKNSRLLAGRPLICHTIDHAREAATLGRVIVSTDGDEIAAAAVSMGAGQLEVVRRPRELATDTASVAAAARHAIEESGASEPIVVILYANVPVRPPGLIDRAVGMLIETGADSVQSYVSVGKHHPCWMVALEAGHRVQPYRQSTIDRRQDLPRLLVPDGGVIAAKRTCLLEAPDDQPHAFLGTDRRGFETTPGSVVDVDTAADLLVAEAILAQTAQGAAR